MKLQIVRAAVAALIIALGMMTPLLTSLDERSITSPSVLVGALFDSRPREVAFAADNGDDNGDDDDDDDDDDDNSGDDDDDDDDNSDNSGDDDDDDDNSDNSGDDDDDDNSDNSGDDDDDDDDDDNSDNSGDDDDDDDDDDDNDDGGDNVTPAAASSTTVAVPAAGSAAVPAAGSAGAPAAASAAAPAAAARTNDPGPTFDTSVTQVSGITTGGESAIALPGDRIVVKTFPGIPAGISITIRVLNKASFPTAPGAPVIALIFQVEARDATGALLSTLPAEMNLSARYTNSEVAGLDKRRATLWWFNPAVAQWGPAPKLVVDPTFNFVSSSTQGLGTYCVCLP